MHGAGRAMWRVNRRYVRSYCHKRAEVKLRSNANGKKFNPGTPWIFADEIAMDRRTKALPPGTVATLVDAQHVRRCTIAFNPLSKIAGRVLDRNPEAEVDGPWFEQRLQAALAARSVLYESPFYRLVHAEGDGLPGLVVDRYGEVVVVQPNAAWAETHLLMLVDALRTVVAPTAVVVNRGSRARAAEGLSLGGDEQEEGDKGEAAVAAVEVVHGDVTGPLAVPHNGAVCMADVVGGQKTGLYLDQRDNQALAARLAHGKTMLDVFSHVGGFSLSALAAGATYAMAVDSSAAALALAKEGSRRSQVSGRFETRKGSAFDVMADMWAQGQQFGVVVCDPPAFAPNRAAIRGGLRAYEKTARLAARLVEAGGTLVLCSCSHAVDLEAFRGACTRGIASARRSAALIHAGGAGPDHPVHLGLPETGYLKALFFRMGDE